MKITKRSLFCKKCLEKLRAYEAQEKKEYRKRSKVKRQPKTATKKRKKYEKQSAYF